VKLNIFNFIDYRDKNIDYGDEKLRDFVRLFFFMKSSETTTIACLDETGFVTIRRQAILNSLAS